jgi:hypothetical protein
MTTSPITASSPGLLNAASTYPPAETVPKEANHPAEKLTPFQRKLFRKITKYPHHPLHAWVTRFADQLSGHCSEVGEAGISLANQILKFRPESKIGQAVCEHLEKIVYTADFLDKSIVDDPLAINRSASTLNFFARAIEVTVKRYSLIAPSDVPKELTVNPDLVADPQIKFYNLSTATGDLRLCPIDDTIQMKVAFILADFRKQLLQKLIPQDEKDRAHQELYVRKKLQTALEFIEQREEALVVDESKVSGVYKKMPVDVLKNLILNGTDLNKFYYASTGRGRFLYSIPIQRKQGYSNPEILISHVFEVINNQSEFWSGYLRQQLQEPSESMPSEKLSQYLEEKDGSITRDGIKALLYSTGYLKASE